MALGIRGKVAVVTGAGNGIGRAIAVAAKSRPISPRLGGVEPLITTRAWVAFRAQRHRRSPHPPGHKFDRASELSVHSTEQATVIGKRPF